MDVRERQLASLEQEEVLRGLAYAAARPGCRFLEVGSWCGDSTVILGRVLREIGGHLFCVDWWKGNPDTELADIAARTDIFAVFWERICSEELQDVVIPMRGPSAVVAPVLRLDSFRLVFLDADHRYESVKNDLEAYAPLVSRDGGILCGHDCEGQLTDYDAEFLMAGMDIDAHESVHCGVVRAVGTAFPECSLQHSIWSVRALGPKDAWEPTNLDISAIPRRRQAPPPPIASTATHNLLRYGKRVYAIPHAVTGFDITDEGQRNQPGIFSARTRQEAEEHIRHVEEQTRQAEERARQEAIREQALREEALRAMKPTLLEEGYLGFNIVAYQRRFFCVAQSLGPLDLANLSDTAVAELKRRSHFFVADSHQAARLQVNQARLEAALLSYTSG